MPELDRQLRENKIGGIISTHTDEPCIVYLRKPTSCSQVLLNLSTVLLESSELLRSLCELNDFRKGFCTTWNSKMHSMGCLDARCSRFGNPVKSRGKGVRKKPSQKVGCIAALKTKLVHPNREKLLYDSVRELCRDLKLETEIDTGSALFTLCRVKKLCFTHINHETVYSNADKSALAIRREDILSHPEFTKSIQNFLKIHREGYATVLKATQFLSERYPDVLFNDEAARNAITVLKVDDEDAERLLTYLEAQKRDSKVEFLAKEIHNESGALSSLTWAFRGATELTRRCSDVAYWDSTHEISRYAYKLSTLSLVDSECKTRPVLFQLMLNQTSQNHSSFLRCWNTAFQTKFPTVLFTDGEEALHIAISEVFSGGNVKNLLCLFHLFEMNARKKIQHALRGTPGWPSFRKELEKCREALTEEQLSGLWKELLDKWLPTSQNTRSARSYLIKYVWSRRSQWATCYFPKEFTLGSMSTSRSEGWHSLLKKFSTCTTVFSLVKDIELLVERQHFNELELKNKSLRLDSIKEDPILGTEYFKGVFLREKFSCYTLSEISREMRLAFRFHLITLSMTIDETIETNNVFIVNATVVHSYYSNSDSVHNTGVLLKIDAANSSVLRWRCDCFYPNRMCFPCRHILTVALAIDKGTCNDCMSMKGILEHRSILEIVLCDIVAARWRHKSNFKHGAPKAMWKKTNMTLHRKIRKI